MIELSFFLSKSVRDCVCVCTVYHFTDENFRFQFFVSLYVCVGVCLFAFCASNALKEMQFDIDERRYFLQNCMVQGCLIN